MRKLLAVTVLAVAVIATAVASAGGTTVSASPNPVAVGGQFTIEICGTGGKTVDFHVIAPDGSTTDGQFYTGGDCATTPAFTASQAGTYAITVTNRNGKHLYAQTFLTAS